MKLTGYIITTQDEAESARIWAEIDADNERRRLDVARRVRQVIQPEENRKAA